MQHYYKMTIAGLERSLPICRVSDELYIGAFVIFGDAPLTVACARELLAKAPEYDYLIRPRASRWHMKWPSSMRTPIISSPGSTPSSI